MNRPADFPALVMALKVEAVTLGGMETIRGEAELEHVAHAVNAYPKLIEALCRVADAKGLEQGVLAALDCKTLLRELGELA